MCLLSVWGELLQRALGEYLIPPVHFYSLTILFEQINDEISNQYFQRNGFGFCLIHNQKFIHDLLLKTDFLRSLLIFISELGNEILFTRLSQAELTVINPHAFVHTLKKRVCVVRVHIFISPTSAEDSTEHPPPSRPHSQITEGQRGLWVWGGRALPLLCVRMSVCPCAVSAMGWCKHETKTLLVSVTVLYTVADLFTSGRNCKEVLFPLCHSSSFTRPPLHDSRFSAFQLEKAPNSVWS